MKSRVCEMAFRGVSRGSLVFLRTYAQSVTPSTLTHPPLIWIYIGSFYRRFPSHGVKDPDNLPIFRNLRFLLPSKPEPRGGETPKDLQELQHWAIIGSGKTELLEILRGQYVAVPPRARTFPYLATDEIAAKDPRLRHPGNAIQYVGFSGEGSKATGGTRGAYLSARYESLREDTDWTLRQYLRGQTELNPLEGQAEGRVHDEALLDRVIRDLKLQDLLDMPVANLSNGQTRRSRIAKALLLKPELLLLDEPFMGLDPATTKSISTLLEGLANRSSPRLIISLRPQDEIPHWITHLLVIANGNQIVFQDTREAAHEFFKQWKALHQPGRDPLTQEQDRKQILDQNFFVDVGLSESNFAEKWTGALPMQGEPLVEMEGVQVRYGDKTVLGDWRQNVNGEEKDGLHWKVRRGQSWAILGANGSGKSTLLSLITSDHPQAYALPIQLFGRSRLPEPGKPAISLFDLQSRLGHSSPEVHAFFPRQLSIRQALESAWADTFLSKPVLNLERDRDVEELLRFFRSDLGPKSHAKAKSGTTRSKKMSAALRTQFPPLDLWEMSQQELLLWADEDLRWADEVLFSALTTEQQRLVLFLRTIVHRPDLIILDEAFSGMSASLRQKCFHLLQSGVAGRDSNGSNGSNESISPFSAGPFLTDQQSLIIVSHLKEEVPDFVRFWMRLPSDVGLDNTLPFAMGTLSEDMFISRGQTWDQLWALKKPREDASRALPRTSSRWSSL